MKRGFRKSASRDRGSIERSSIERGSTERSSIERGLKRRDFLRGAGAFGALGAAASVFPWLTAKAQSEGTPRLVIFYTPHGTVRDRWLPTGTETTFTLPSILQPLEAHRRNITVLDGLDLGMTPGVRTRRVPHTFDMVSLLTGSDINTSDTDFMREHFGGTYFGWNLSESVDQAIATRLPAGETPFQSIELGVACGGAHPNSRMSYSAPRAPRHPIDAPIRAYNQLFGDAFEPDRDLQTLRRRSVLDSIHEDLGLVAGRLSPRDRNRLEQHAAAIRRIEQSLGAEYTCTAPTMPGGGTAQVTIDQQSDLLAAALGCGMTRVISHQIRQGDNDGSLYEWLGITAEGHHTITHNQSGASQDQLAVLYNWYAARFAYLLDQLAATPDGESNLLENSLVLWVTELNRGWDHNIDSIPLVVAGGAAGRHTGGRFLTRSGQTNRLLVSAFHGMGMTDVERFGLADEGSGGVEGLLSSV